MPKPTKTDAAEGSAEIRTTCRKLYKMRIEITAKKGGEEIEDFREIHVAAHTVEVAIMMARASILEPDEDGEIDLGGEYVRPEEITNIEFWSIKRKGGVEVRA